MNSITQKVVSNILKDWSEPQGNLFLAFPPRDTLNADAVVAALLAHIHSSSGYRSEPYSDVCLQLDFPLQADDSGVQVKFFDAPYAVCKFRNSVAIFAIDLSRLAGAEGGADFARFARYLETLPPMQFIFYASATDSECRRLAASLVETGGMLFQTLSVPPLNKAQLSALVMEQLQTCGVAHKAYRPYIAAYIRENEAMGEKDARRFAAEIIRTAKKVQDTESPKSIIRAAADALSTNRQSSMGKIGF